jgi:hypothetical protein
MSLSAPSAKVERYNTSSLESKVTAPQPSTYPPPNTHSISENPTPESPSRLLSLSLTAPTATFTPNKRPLAKQQTTLKLSANVTLDGDLPTP